MRSSIIIIIALALAFPGAASASIASRDGSMITIVGGGETNDIDVNIGSDRLHDTAGITAGTGCVQEGPTTVYCDSLLGAWVTAELGAGNDEIGVLGRGQLWEVHGGPGDDTIRGEEAENWLFGDEGWDVLFGYGGDDTIDGGPGSDQLNGDGIYEDYGGNDTLQARDGEYDDVSCGWGIDVATVDPIDNVFVECEQVDRGTPTPNPQPSPPPPPTTQPSPDMTPPTLELAAARSLSLRRALRRGMRLSTTTNEAGRIVVRAFVDRKTARRFKLKKNANSAVVVGSLARNIGIGTTVMTLKLSRKARSRLQRANRVRLRIVIRITDSAGNIGSETLRITLKRTPAR